jgi:hypothetical protein
MTTIGISIASIMMFIRWGSLLSSPGEVDFIPSISVLYSGRGRVEERGEIDPEERPVVGGVLFLLILHVSVNSYLVSRQVPVPHNPASGVHSCTGIFQQHLYEPILYSVHL